MVREYRRIIEFAKTASGGTPSRDRLDYFKGNIRWVTTSELRDSYIEDTNEHISKEAVANSSAKVFPANTLLMAMYGATIGRLGIIANEAATNQACCAIFPDNTVDTKYLFYCLLYDRKNIVDKGCGAGQPNISQDIIKNIEVPYCDLVEQKAIAIALSDVDELILNLEKQIKKYQSIKTACLQHMFPQNAETAPTMRLPGFSGAWELRKLGDWGDFYYGRSCPKWSVSNSASIPCIRYGELYTKFGAKIDRVYSYTSISPDNLRFSKGTEVLIPRVGEDPMDYNHCAWLSLKNVAIGEMISVFNTNQNPLFSAIMFNAVLKEEFAKRVEGGSVTNLYYEKLKDIDIRYPSLLEQKAIADYFEELDSLISISQRKLEKYKKVKQGMMQKLLTGEIRLV